MGEHRGGFMGLGAGGIRGMACQRLKRSGARRAGGLGRKMAGH
jgi:hypothetical protein